jgi:hypothetical protein
LLMNYKYKSFTEKSLTWRHIWLNISWLRTFYFSVILTINVHHYTWYYQKTPYCYWADMSWLFSRYVIIEHLMVN